MKLTPQRSLKNHFLKENYDHNFNVATFCKNAIYIVKVLFMVTFINMLPCWAKLFKHSDPVLLCQTRYVASIKGVQN